MPEEAPTTLKIKEGTKVICVPLFLAPFFSEQLKLLLSVLAENLFIHEQRFRVNPDEMEIVVLLPSPVISDKKLCR